MKMKTLLPLMALVVLASCAKVKEPEFKRLESFKVKKIGLQEITIGFAVTYYNPNKFGLGVKEAEADIYLDSVFLGKFTQDADISVKETSDFSIPLSGTIPMQKALQLNLQDIGKREILVKADGAVKVVKAGITVRKPFQYEGRHKLGEIKF
jgi:LEA14-like dessication related protein